MNAFIIMIMIITFFLFSSSNIFTIKATAHAFFIPITCRLFNVDWLAYFQRWANLIGLLKCHIALSEILLTASADQLLYNSSLIKLCWCLFIVSKIDIIWFSWATAELTNYQLWTNYKIFLSLKYLLNFFLATGWLHLFTRVRKMNFIEIQLLKHSSNKFSLLCYTLSDSYFNKNVLYQIGFQVGLAY